MTVHIGHPDEVQALNGLLAGYAAGTLGAPLHALVSAHLVLKPDNRGFVRSLEALRAHEIDMVAPVALRRRDEMLESIFSGTVDAAMRRAPTADDVLPTPISSLIGGDLAAVKWKTVLPGIRECRISNDQHGEASLLWIKPGKMMPSHTHDGSEVTLVLKGGLYLFCCVRGTAASDRAIYTFCETRFRALGCRHIAPCRVRRVNRRIS